MNLEKFLDRSPESLSLAERREAAGLWFAFEIYTPENLALREIRAVASNASHCVEQLVARGLDPAHYELVLQAPPFA